MNLWLVIGGSRGFGETLWKTLHAQELNKIVVYSRSPLNDLPSTGRVTHCTMDIGNLNELSSVFTESLETLKSETWDKVNLVNCAAVLGPMENVEDHKDYNSVINAVNINYTSRFIINSIFLRAFKKNITLVDISSGAHKQGSSTWGIYCSTKAANVVLHQSIAKENENCRVLNYSPGIMKTKMQDEIADSSIKSPTKEFLGKIIALGRAVPIQDSVNELLRVLEEDKFNSGDYVDIYDKIGPPSID